MFFKRKEKEEGNEGIKLLAVTQTESETVIIESLLSAEKIPFMIKHGNLYEYFGNIPFFEKTHAMIYVPENAYDRAKEIISPPDEIKGDTVYDTEGKDNKSND